MADQTDTRATQAVHSDPELERHPLVRWITLTTVVAIVFLGSVTTTSLPVPPGTDLVGLTASEARHFLAYAGLTGLLTVAIAGSEPSYGDRRQYRKLLLVFLTVVGFGAAVEAIQIPLAHRTGSLRDVGFNAIGATSSLIGVVVLARIRRARS